MIKCKICKKILIENLTEKEYLEKFSDEKFMWCNYCRNIFEIGKKEVGE